jgi:hypothetical protein
VFALEGGVVEGVHEVEYVIGEFAAGAVGAVGAERHRHVGDGEAAGVFGIAVGEREVAPFRRVMALY